MNRHYIWLAVLMLVMILVALVACGPAETPVPAEAAPTFAFGASASGPSLADMEKSVTTPWKDHLKSHNVHDMHIRWALRDGVHRARFHAMKAQTVLEGF